MTILQQPDILSLSGNIKEFRIGTTETISFVLKQGSEDIITQSYDPGKDGIVIINVRDIVHSRLSFTLLESALIYQQTSLVSAFTAIIAGVEVSFRVIRSGVDRLADTPTNFLTQNFLTWQPSVKPVTYYSPEFLTYYAVNSCLAKLRAYFTDSSGKICSQKDIILASFEPNAAYTMPLQYASVAEKLDNTLPAYYDVWIESMDTNRLTYIQRYYASNMLSEQEQWILFENSLGGIDTFRAYGSTDFAANHTHNVAEIAEVSTEYRVDTERKFQKNTGHLNAKERQWLLDFFPSQMKYIYSGTYLRRIVVSESSVEFIDRELPSAYTFTYKYADARPFLNLPRIDIPSEVLDITVPSVGSFTVPPRLVEFPRLPLTEGALFPVQNPYSEKWNTTTTGSLGDFIAERLSQNYGGSGGIGHQHNNIDLLQLLSYMAEYLLVAGKKIKAGYADKAGGIDGLEDSFLLKDRPDRTNFLLELLGGIAFKNNYGIDSTGRAKLNSLEADYLKIQELIFNRVSAQEGDTSFSESGVIESVERLVDGTYNLALRKRHEGDFTAFTDHDIAYGSVNDLLSGGGNHYSSWFRILNVNLQANVINVTLYLDAEVPGGKNSAPEPLMVITRRGNAVNPKRQSYFFLSSSEGRLVRLNGVTKPILEDYNYASSLGSTPDLKILENLPVNKNQDYLFARGAIIQDLVLVDIDGKPIYELVNRGIWSLEAATSDEPYYFEGHNPKKQRNETSTVYNRGSKWQCLHTGTQLEPVYGSPDWAFLEGNGEFSISFDSSRGFSFFYGRVDTILEARFFHGSVDVTGTVMATPGTVINWSRHSGLDSEDKSWTPAFSGSKNQVRLIDKDMPSNWMQKRVVVFKIEIEIPQGRGNYLNAAKEIGIKI